MDTIDTINMLDHQIGVVDKAKGYITDMGWCQDFYAVDERGISVEQSSGEAVAFCAMGALYRASRSLPPSLKHIVRDKVERMLDEVACREDSSVGSISGFNDTEDREAWEVVHMFDIVRDRLEGALEATLMDAE